MITHPATGERTRESLYRSWSELRARYPSISARAAALTLDASEAQLAAARCTCGEGTALAAAPAALLSAVAALGPVTARTASHGAVLDNVGTYGAPDIGEHTGIVIGDGIDLRIFPRGWAFAYALSDTAESDVQRSVQIFDAAGEASHTIYLRPDSDIQAYEMLVNALASTEIAEPVLRADGPLPVETADDAIDRDAYRQAFAAMTDTHDFFMLLHRFGLTREQGLRLAGPEFARVVARNAHRALFRYAAEASIPLMIFVANSGMVQISSGIIPVPTFAAASCALSDTRFTLQLAEDAVARAWSVRKPTVNGCVTSLELYAADGSLIVQIFGERHAGETERADWAAAVGTLPRV